MLPPMLIWELSCSHWSTLKYVHVLAIHCNEPRLIYISLRIGWIKFKHVRLFNQIVQVIINNILIYGTTLIYLLPSLLWTFITIKELLFHHASIHKSHNYYQWLNDLKLVWLFEHPLIQGNPKLLDIITLKLI